MSDKRVAVFLIGAALTVWYFAAKSRDDSPPPHVSNEKPAGLKSPEQAAADDHQHLLATVHSDAKYAAREIISKRLKSPSQASFSDDEVVETTEGYALVYLVAEAPNSFGVRLRQGYCVVLWFDGPRGDTFKWNRAMGVITCHDRPDEGTRWALKAANGWPNLGEPPASLAAAKPTRKHR